MSWCRVPVSSEAPDVLTGESLSRVLALLESGWLELRPFKSSTADTNAEPHALVVGVRACACPCVVGMVMW